MCFEDDTFAWDLDSEGQWHRRTGKTHREIQGRINRETKVKSVANATIDQLERGNDLLRRELSR